MRRWNHFTNEELKNNHDDLLRAEVGLPEVSFVFQATVATATTSFLTGVALIITVPVSQDLGMTQGEIAWISASTRYEWSIGIIQTSVLRY